MASESERFIVKVKTLNQELFEVRVSSDMVVKTFKELIQSEHGVPVERQRIIYRGKVLKDEETLGSYKIQKETVLHLVVRKDVSSESSQPQQPPAEESASTSSTHDQLGPGSFLMGAINISEGDPLPDLNSLVSSMLQSVGVSPRDPSGNAPGNRMNNSGSNIPVTQVLDSIQSNLSHARNFFEYPSEEEEKNMLQAQPHEPIEVNMANYVALLESLSTTMSTAVDACNRLRSSLAGEEYKSMDMSQREDFQRRIKCSGKGFANLSAALGKISRVTNSLEITSPDSSPQFILPQSSTIQISTGTFGIPVPSARSDTSSDSLSNILNAVNSLVSGRSREAQISSTMSANSTGSNSQVSDSSRAQHGASTNPTPAPLNVHPQDGQRSSNAVPPIGNLFQMMSGALGGNPSSSQRDASFASQNMGNIMSSMLAQMMGTSSSNSNPNLGDLLRSVQGNSSSDSANSNPSTGIESLISGIVESLTMPDMMGLISGNWSAFDRVQPVIRQNVLSYLSSEAGLNYEHSDSFMASSAEFLATRLSAMLPNAEAISTSIRSHLNPASNLQSVSSSFLKSRMEEFVKIICREENSENSNAFSDSLRAWASQTVGGWVKCICECFDNGSQSAYVFVDETLRRSLSSLGPELAMMGSFAGPIIGGIVRKCHSTYLEGRTNTSMTENWNGISEEEKSEIMSTIAVDEERQRRQPRQRPFSDAYASANSKKKQKVSGSSNSASTPEAGLQKQLQDALNVSENAEYKSDDGSKIDLQKVLEESGSFLGSNYRSRLVSDLSSRIQQDPDFDPSQFPNAAAKLRDDQH